MTQSIKNAILCERRQKKAAALTRILVGLGLSHAKVLAESAEDISTEERFDLITIRLVRLDRALLDFLHIALSSNGTIVYYAQPPSVLDTTLWDSECHAMRVGKSAGVKHVTLFKRKL